MTAEKLERSILLEVPQIPLVLQQLSLAMNIAKEGKSEEEYGNSLQLAYDLIPYAKQGGGDNFFKYHVLIVALLAGIENVTENKDFEVLDNATGTIRNGLERLNKVDTQEYYKVLVGDLVNLMKENVDVFCIKAQSIINEVKTCNKEKLLGYAYVILSLMYSNLEVPPVAMPYYNNLLCIVGQNKF